MKTLTAFLVTLGLIVLSTVIADWTHISAQLLMILGTSLWAAVDSAKIKLVNYRSGISYGPVVLFFACALLWIVGFPWYLIVRNKIKAGVAELKSEPDRSTA